MVIMQAGQRRVERDRNHARQRGRRNSGLRADQRDHLARRVLTQIGVGRKLNC